MNYIEQEVIDAVADVARASATAFEVVAEVSVSSYGGCEFTSSYLVRRTGTEETWAVLRTYRMEGYMSLDTSFEVTSPHGTVTRRYINHRA